MNIYFACSITGGRQDEAVYQRLVTTMLADGHEVPTALLARSEVMAEEGIVSPEEVYQRDINWIMGCDLLMAEVSTPSHGVGYEIGYALSLDKPVLCLYRQGGKVSKMILGNPHSNLTVLAYESPEEAVHVVRAYLAMKERG